MRLRNVFGVYTLMSFAALLTPTARAQGVEPLKRALTLSKQSDILSVQLAMSKKLVQLGEAPVVSLTFTNLGKENAQFPSDVRVHVEGNTGEPKTTLYQRQLTHTLHTGEPSIAGGGFEPTVEAGNSFTRNYDLSKLYDLNVPGQYFVYVEVMDIVSSKTNAGVWVRSDTVKFTVNSK